MEDAATAEISRAQIWQWRVQGVSTQDDSQLITSQRIAELVDQEVGRHSGGKWNLAGRLVEEMLTKNELDDFLTSVCYPYIVTAHESNGTAARL